MVDVEAKDKILRAKIQLQKSNLCLSNKSFKHRGK